MEAGHQPPAGTGNVLKHSVHHWFAGRPFAGNEICMNLVC
jgi:hypothetical protein